VHFAEFFQKIIITTLKLKFFKFLALFQSVLAVSCLLIQQRKNSLNYRNFTKHILAILKVSWQQAC